MLMNNKSHLVSVTFLQMTSCTRLHSFSTTSLQLDSVLIEHTWRGQLNTSLSIYLYDDCEISRAKTWIYEARVLFQKYSSQHNMIGSIKAGRFWSRLPSCGQQINVMMHLHEQQVGLMLRRQKGFIIHVILRAVQFWRKEFNSVC